MYLRDLPQCPRDMLCSCLDANKKWGELGIQMGFDDVAMNRIERLAPYLPNKSPTNYLFTEWENERNGEVLTLFGYLHLANNLKAMRILKPFVDQRFRRFVNEEEGYFSGKDQLSSSKPSNSPNRNLRQNAIGSVPVAQPHQRRAVCGSSSDTPVKLECGLTQSSQVCSFHIPYEELQKGTNNWSMALVLGEGGYGKVFKGSWKNTEVAIKRLESTRSNNPRKCKNAARQNHDSLRKELKYLTKYRHDNILPLYGYSINGENPCLVYQFMSNGSLEDQLQLRRNTKVLSWWTRVTIARGSARGLQFLHSVDDALIHGDIKSANILLDSNFVPKVGDFGLAKDGPIKDYTHIDLTTVHGTQFYVPAEVLRGKKLSVKADTYAFGVVLCELATGLLAGVYQKNRTVLHLRDICHNHVLGNCLSRLKDPKAGNRDEEFYEDLIRLGIKCTSEIARKRPLMADVLNELDIIVKLRGQRPTPPPVPEPMQAGDTYDNTEFNPVIFTC